MSNDLDNNLLTDEDTADGGKAWNKSDDIPRRFDELPPEQDWTPVADVIKSQREEIAKHEAEEVKIIPPSDDSSESEVEDSQDVQRVAFPPKTGNIKSKYSIEGSKSKTLNISQEDATGVDKETDAVTQSMMKFALSTDYIKKRTNQEMQEHYEQQNYTRDAATICQEQPKKVLNIPASHDNKARTSVSPSGGDIKHKFQGHKNASPRYIYSPHFRTSQFADDYKVKKSQPRHEPEPDYNPEHTQDTLGREVEYHSESGHYYEHRGAYYTTEGYHHGREREYYGNVRKYQHEMDRDYHPKQVPYYYEEDRNYHHDQHVDYWRRSKDDQSRSNDSCQRKLDQHQDHYHDDYYQQYRKGNFTGDKTPSTFGRDQMYSSLQEYNVEQDSSCYDPNQYQISSWYDPNQYHTSENNPQYHTTYYDRDKSMAREPQQMHYEKSQLRERSDEVLY